MTDRVTLKVKSKGKDKGADTALLTGKPTSEALR